MRFGRTFLAAGVAILLLTACSADDTADGPMTVIVDSDGAFDDIKAILYLLEQPDIEIIALTFSGTGIAHCPAAAENTSALLERIEAPQIPVACGRTTPLEGDNEAPPMWRNAADTLGGVDLPEPRPLHEAGATDLLTETLGSADEVVVVALGPLTNIAEAVQDDPEVLDSVTMMYLMGGAVDAGGNALENPDAEFNIWADPLAAQIVFDTDVPITLVPLDATNHVPVTPYLYDAVAAHRDYSETSRFTADYLEVSPLLGGMYHWDELAAVVATDESVATLEERSLLVDTAGATIEDPSGRVTRVAVAADPEAFEAHFYSAIIGTPDPGIARWTPDAVMTWDGSICSYDGPDPLPDDLWIRIDNNADEGLVAFVTGIYDAGTTVADFEASLAAGAPGAPDWWLERAVITAPAGARDVWPTKGGPAITALCYADPTQVWEVAGPRLPN